MTHFVATEELVGFLEDIAEVIEDVADKMPDHGEFVAKLPPSSRAKPAAQPPAVNFALKYERITRLLRVRKHVARRPQADASRTPD